LFAEAAEETFSASSVSRGNELLELGKSKTRSPVRNLLVTLGQLSLGTLVFQLEQTQIPSLRHASERRRPHPARTSREGAVPLAKPAPRHA
jgi:hypothetical protein